MRDMQSHTEIEVVVHAGPSDMYKFDGQWTIDPEARARALFALMSMYQMLGPQIKYVEPSADGTQLSVGHSESSSDRICCEFCRYGHCSRHASCEWDHIAMEHFVITIVMQPWGEASPAPAPVAPAAVSAVTTDPTYVSPQSGADKQASLEGVSDDEQTISTAAGSDRSDSSPPTPVRTPLMRFRSRSDRVCWADLEDDD
jgi:hypothetical protein